MVQCVFRICFGRKSHRRGFTTRLWGIEKT